jgi:hypothetical protein
MTQEENVAQSIDRGTFSYPPRICKLTEEDRQAVRSAYDGTVKHLKLLADSYQVSRSLIEKTIYSHQGGRTH